MKLTTLFLFLCVLLSHAHCGGSSSVSGTETGSTTSGVNTSTLATRVESVADSLVPSMNASSSSSSLSAMTRLITFGSDEDWATFIDEDNSYLITDVFGGEEEAPEVVTKIRVLLGNLQGTLESLFSTDEDFSCTGGSVLDEGDTLEVAFYGELSNGTSDDRLFDCTNTGSNDETFLYGQDSDGVVRIVEMSENTSTNTEQTETRGDTTQFYQSIFTTYAEATESEQTVVYLDLQYVQATVYNGLDDEFGTSDDVVFKSRTRIVGRATLDDDGNVSSSTGDFSVIKYDEGVNEDESTYTITTQTFGRGGYEDGEVSLFRIETDASAAADSSGTFCLEHATDTLPSATDTAECESLEEAFAWEDAEFPFTVSPSLEEVFESNVLFEDDDEDLIANDGSNFTIPTYTTTSVESE